MAENKELVFKLTTDANTAILEQYAELMNTVLRSYDENIEQLQRYNTQIKQNEAIIKQINAAKGEERKALVEQYGTVTDLTKAVRADKMARQQLMPVIKEQEKQQLAVGDTYKQTNSTLNLLRMTFRGMTEEQKRANKELVPTIEKLDQSVKKQDASIGNFQRNVGNYPQLMQQILPVQGQFGNGLMSIAEKAGLSGGALGVLGGALGAAAAAYKMFNDAQELTQTIGDEVAIKVAGWEAVYDRFIRMLVSADFSNFWQQLRQVKEVGEETAAILDELFERNNALTIAEAEASIEQQKNLMIMRDQTKTLQERQAAGRAYIESVRELAKVRQDIAQQEFDARLQQFASQTGLNEEDVQFYIKNYNKYRVAVNDYIDDTKQLEKAEEKRNDALKMQNYRLAQEYDAKIISLRERTNAVFNSLSNEEQRFFTIAEKYNLGNDELTSQLVQAWAKVSTAISNAEQSAQRAATTVNSLTAQQNRADLKAGATTKTQPSELKIDTSKAMLDIHNFGADLDEWAEGIKPITPKINLDPLRAEFDTIGKQIDEEIAAEFANFRPLGTSPLALALKVTDEELQTIKSQAISAAQSIFNSIQQISQEATQRRLDNELKALDDQTDTEKAKLKARYESGALSRKQYEKKLEEIDATTEAKREELQKEQFEKNKRWNILSALMNGALAITQVFATTPTPASWIMAGLIAATTAAQVAAIASQKYAKGGLLRGASHENGGIKGHIEGQNFEVEGDEYVVRKKVTRKHLPFLNWFNANGDKYSTEQVRTRFAPAFGTRRFAPAFGTRRFAKGGVLGSYDVSPAAIPQQTASIVQTLNKQTDELREYIHATNRRIDRLSVYVTTSAIENAIDSKNVHVSRATLP